MNAYFCYHVMIDSDIIRIYILHRSYYLVLCLMS